MKINEHKKQFGNLAEDYTKYRKPYDGRLFELLFSLAGEGDKKILDIACGTGKSTEALVRKNIEVFGCDHDPLMIEEAKKQVQIKGLNIDYKVAEVENLPYKDGEFDIVVVGTAFHWFVNEKAITEIKRVLKKEGLLFVFWTNFVKDVPDENSIPVDFFGSFNWARVPEELRDLEYISTFLNKNGIKNVSVSHIPCVTRYTLDEYVGLMKTASSYGVLTETEKVRFVKELTELLGKKLGNRTHFSLEDELQICYGFKK